MESSFGPFHQSKNEKFQYIGVETTYSSIQGTDALINSTSAQKKNMTNARRADGDTFTFPHIFMHKDLQNQLNQSFLDFLGLFSHSRKMPESIKKSEHRMCPGLQKSVRWRTGPVVTYPTQSHFTSSLCKPWLALTLLSLSIQ